MNTLFSWLGQFGQIDQMALWAENTVPVLPGPALIHAYMVCSWSVLLAGLAGQLCARFSRITRLTRFAVVILTLLAGLLPGAMSYTFWLGLAFQAPSVTATFLGAILLYRALWPEADAPNRTLFVKPDPLSVSTPSTLSKCFSRPVWGLLAAVLLGYMLLLDTFALWPLQLYAWGFGGASIALVVAALVLTTALTPKRVLPLKSEKVVALNADRPESAKCAEGAMGAQESDRAKYDGWIQIVLLPLVLLFFVLTRLPTGNLWDALLDPLLWIVLQVYAIRVVRALFKASNVLNANKPIAR